MLKRDALNLIVFRFQESASKSIACIDRVDCEAPILTVNEQQLSPTLVCLVQVPAGILWRDEIHLLPRR